MAAVDAGLEAIHVEIERKPGSTRSKINSDAIVGAHDAFKSTLADIKSKTKFLLSKPFRCSAKYGIQSGRAKALNVVTKQRLPQPASPVFMGRVQGQLTHDLRGGAGFPGGYAVPAWPNAGENSRADFTVETWIQFPDSATTTDGTPQVLNFF